MTGAGPYDDLLAGSARLRVALALGDQEREQRLRPALETDPDLLVVAQCLGADQLVEVVETQRLDGVIVACDVHRLTDATLRQLDRRGPPLVVLDRDPTAERWHELRGVVLPLDADASAVSNAVKSVRRGQRPVTQTRPTTPADPPVQPSGADLVRNVIVVTGGHGSPGRSTVAINLATALGAAAPTALVDLDLSSPSIAAYLDLDPSRNICTLGHAVREDAFGWTRALADELQSLGPASSHGQVLCGLPKRELRSSITPGLIERLVAELARRHRYVVLDVGAELLGTGPIPNGHRAALGCATNTLLVTSADLIGLWHMRTALATLESQQLTLDQAHLVINRFDARHHHGRSEIEWHLGVATAAVIPYDQRGMQRAVAEQRPVVLDGSSRAGRALLGLSERLHQDRLRLAPGARRHAAQPWWRRWHPPAFLRVRGPGLQSDRSAPGARPLTADPIAVTGSPEAERPW
jgi:MinD-like ATPase involved in chromosome partitioning or flagellar assembly